MERRSIARVSEGEHAARGKDPSSQRIQAVGHHLILVDLDTRVNLVLRLTVMADVTKSAAPTRP
jgi:hypothetical protein